MYPILIIYICTCVRVWNSNAVEVLKRCLYNRSYWLYHKWPAKHSFLESWQQAECISKIGTEKSKLNWKLIHISRFKSCWNFSFSKPIEKVNSFNKKHSRKIINSPILSSKTSSYWKFDTKKESKEEKKFIQALLTSILSLGLKSSSSEIPSVTNSTSIASYKPENFMKTK